MSDHSNKNWEEHLKILTDQLKQYQSLSQNVSKKSAELDQWLQLFNHFSSAIYDIDKRKAILSAISSLDTNEPEEEEKQITGDFIYDLFTTPAMKDIVKEVMNRKIKF